MTDRNAIALVPYTLAFNVARVAPYTLENRNNNSPTTATPLATPTSQWDGSYSPLSYAVSGNQPYFTASAALRGAGQPLDLVTANYSSGTISVLLGNGDGTFQAPVTYAVGSNPIALAIGDLTGDGKLDIAVANYGSSNVSVLVGNGDGTFQSAVTYAVGSNPRGVAIADLDGKNGNDLAVANWGSGNVSVLLNQGHGTFASAVNYNVGTNPGNLVIADLNGDGKLDVATANSSSNTVSILPGNGDGTFGGQITYSTGSGTNPIDVVAVHLTGDGKYDLATANNGSNTVSVLLNQGTPGAALTASTFAAAVSYASGASTPYHLVAADLNKDGSQDLALAGYGSNQVGILLGNGNGTLQAATSLSVGGNPIGITAGNFSGNGILDLATSNYSGNNVTILVGNAVKSLPADATNGLESGYGRGNLSSSSDVDFFSWTGKAGDEVQVASETPGNAGGTYLTYYIENSFGSTLTSFNSTNSSSFSSNNGQGQSVPITLPYTGTYLVEVAPFSGYTGEYRFRVTEVPPTLQLVTSYDNPISSPNTLVLTNTSPGNATAKLAGYIGQGDSNGDFFSLGNLLAGTQLNLTLSQPASSTLGGVLNIYNSAGTNLTNNVTAGNTLSYTVPAGQGGAYYARVSSASTTTVSFWMNWNGTNNEVPISFAGYDLYLDNGSFGFADNGDVYGISSAGLAGSWHLVTAVFVDGNTAGDQLWIDGVQQTLTARVGTIGAAPLVSTGTAIGNYVSGGFAFTGMLDEVAYFDGTLTGAQIQAEYNARNGGNYASVILGQDPVAYYRLGESSGTVAYDSSGAFDNASFGSGITVGVAGALGNDGNTAYQFSGGTISAVVPESTGILGQYVLSIGFANATSPMITAQSLPAQGTASTSIIDQVTLAFSEDMNAASVNTIANYVLVDSNGNSYHLSNPSYTRGTSATYQITDGPLQPGTYTLTISGLTDRMGNVQNPFSLQFSVASVPGLTIQGRGSDNSATPTPLTLTGDPAGTGLFVAGGRGALINNSDVDYWTFSGTSGNSLVISTQNLNSPASSGLEYLVTEPNGSTTLTSFFTASDGDAEIAPITLPATGTYTISVHIDFGYNGEYRFRISSAAPPLQLDKEPNNTIATANALTLATSGSSSVANVAGTILNPSDLNYFNLGTVQAGYSILLSTQLTSSSALSPVVSVYNASGVYQNKTNGRQFDGVGQIDITQTGTYYALMQGGSASGGVLDQYVMNVQIVPTSSLAALPNLEVTNISLPSGSNIESGQPVTISWTVTNEGQAPTNVAGWSDRAVLSLDTTYGNSDDIPLGASNGIFGHSGVLGVGQSYTATETVTLPDGTSGEYFVIVQTDANDQVDENTIGRGDSVTVSSGGPNGNGTFTVIPAPHADLVVQGLTVSGPNAAGSFTVSWKTVNQGAGAVPNNWSEQLVVKDVTTGVTIVNSPLSFGGGLAAGGGTAAHTEPVTGSYAVDSAGHFQVSVTTNSDQSIYEDNPEGHANAVANDTSTTAFDATRDLTVTSLAEPSPANPQSGNQVTLTWKDANTGNLATTSGWNDLVTVVNTTTGATLYSANVAYAGASIQPGGSSATLTTSFTLPSGSAGAGTITVTITVNDNNAESEYNTAGTSANNNSSSINFSSTLVKLISGEVYNDINGDGALDSGDPGLAGWTVNLLNSSSAIVATATTDQSGDYAFTVTNSDTYTVQEVVHAGYLLTAPASGSYTETWSGGQPVTNANFGNFKKVTFSGVAFVDQNGDGSPENSEPGLAGWTVDLTSNSTNQTITTTTGSDGSYSFPGLGPGSYTIAVVAQTGYIATSASSLTETAHSGQSVANADFGEFRPVTLSGDVFLDTNGDGSLDNGESGLSNWVVDLVKGTQTVQTTTGSGGSFSFPNVGPGSYAIQVVQQSGFVPSTAPLNINTSSGQNVTNLNVGEFKAVTVSGEVFKDLDDSGVFKPNDPGLSGWTVNLVNSSNQNVQTATTDANGDYSFSGVGAGRYTIAEVIQPGFVQTEPSSKSITIAPVSGTNLTGEDFGIVTGALLSVTNLATTPSSALVTGTGLTISWDDANGGNIPIADSFTDHVVITNQTTGAVLGVADVSYNVGTRGPLGAGAKAPQQYSFRLPDGNPGVGNIQFTVTADDYDAVSGGLSASGRTAAITEHSALAAYADLAASAIVAPATATPGQTVTITWTESNLGAGAAVAPWADNILLSYDGTVTHAIPVDSIYAAASIPAGQSITQQAQVTIPVTGPAAGGPLQFVVVDNANQSFFELNTANDTTISATVTQVPLSLTLTSPFPSIDENASNPTITGLLARNGPVSQPLVVTLASSDAAQFTVPATVTIPAGQATAPVAITVHDDGIVDPNQTDTITATVAGFQAGQVSIADIDTDQPALSVTFPSSPNATPTISKGGYVTATVTRTGPDDQALTVSMGTNTPTKIFVPASITIPAGSTSANFNIQGVDDDIIEGTLTYAFTASAQGLVQGASDVTVDDTDVPNLSLILAQPTVSESAGPMATTATLSRDLVGQIPVVVALSVPSGSPVTVPATVTIPANQASVTFPVGVFDNNSSQTIQSVAILAEVTTVTNGTALTQGSGSATLHVVNINGPLLSVTFTSPEVIQGESSATTGTVSIENAAAPTSPLTIALTTSDPTAATVPSSVTIPAGATSATFTIATPADTQNRGTVEPAISATAAAYAPGQSQLIVTDTAGSDLVVSSLAGPASVLNGQPFSVMYSVTNQGLAPAVGPWQDTLYVTNQPTGGVLTPLGTSVAFNGTLQPGQSYQRFLTFFAPEQTGNDWIVAQTNVGFTLAEALLTNDAKASAQPMQDLPSYTAKVTPDISSALAGTPVPLSGSATLAGGGPAANQLVNIHIFTAGTERIISALTDQHGNFSTNFQPLPGEAGVYTIGATNPGVSQATVQGGFDIIGMSAQPPTASLSLTEDAAPTGGQFTLTNLTNIALSDLSASVVGAPGNLQVTATVGNGSPNQELTGFGSITVTYQASATDVTTPSGTFTIQVQSAEGASVDVPVSFTVAALAPKLVASPTSLQTAMIIGSQTIVQLTLENQGGAPTGALQVLLPPPGQFNFLALGSPATVGSIAAGGSAQVTLLLVPPSNLPLGTFSGTIVVQGPSSSITVPFKFINLSSAIGELDITTVDEFTYYAQGSPNLAGANVTVTNSLTGVVAETGQTDSNGVLDFPELTEGYYQIHITATDHSPYDGTVLVGAGQATPVTAFLSRQLVQTSFTVMPTSVQDNIQVQVDTTFETNVPAPVITASPSVFDVGGLTQLGQTQQVNLTITNHGLIAAQDLTVNFGTHPYYSIVPLISNLSGLPADSSITIPVVMTRIGVPSSGITAQDAGTVPCSISAALGWKLECGGAEITFGFPMLVINVQGNCAPGPGINGGLININIGAGPGGGPGGSGPGEEFGPVAVSVPSSCDPCLTATAAALLEFAPFPDWYSFGQGIEDVIEDAEEHKFGSLILDGAGTIVDGLKTFGKEVPVLGQVISAIKAAKDIYDGCFAADGGGGEGGGGGGGESAQGGGDEFGGGESGALNELQAYITDFQNLVDETNYLFGSSDWINANTGPNFYNWLGAFSTVVDGNGDNQPITSDQANALESMTLPEGVSLSDVENFVARWNQTLTYNTQGIFTSTQVPAGGTTNFISQDTLLTALQTTDTGYNQIQATGNASFSQGIVYALNQLYADATVGSPAGTVCARVKIQLDQTVTVTRSAFDATLQIEDDKDTPITNIGLTIVVRDASGDDVTNLFDITAPVLTGLNAVDGTGSIAAGTNGQAIFTLIPTDAAAPTQATFYYVSAVLKYQVDGENLAIPFSASTITVEPNPSLTIRYFEQRDVFGPDPTNPNTPSEPFALGVQVLNTGAGTANDVSITSAQPQIVDNVKGLLVNFQVIATEVDGQNLSPSLTASFGNIGPGDVGEGLFLMESSIQGVFTNYSATFQDMSGFGSPQLAIVNSVEIHEMIHLASEIGTGASSGTAFLVDDSPNANNTPDTVYLPDGTTAPVAQATNVNVQGTLGPGSLQVKLTDTSMSGWSYLDIPDPGNGQYQLVSVTRSDGVSLPANDFYQTDRTFIAGGRPPIYENQLHILDDSGTGSYTLTYVAANQTRPSVTSVSAVTPNPTTAAVGSLDVTFNEPIALGTFDSSDLSLTLDNGPNLITPGVTVSLVSGSTYQINGLSALDASDGVYILTVNASGVQDASGNAGSGSGFMSWVMASAAPAVSTITGVTPGQRNTPVGTVSVTFTGPIEPSSFGLSALELTENGGSNLITAGSGVTITQEGPNLYQVGGLSALTTTDGDFVLSVSGSQVTDPNGNPGIGSFSVAWTMDTQPPLVQSFSAVTSPRNTAVGSIDVTFSKLIDPTTFTSSALSLTLGGGSNLISSGVTVALVSASTYEISGLAALTAADGTYKLTVNGADINDLAGNAGVNSLSTSWVTTTNLVAAPSNLAITPNTGISPGLTDTGVVTLTGTLGEPNVTVDVFDVTTNTDLGAATVNGTLFSMAIDLAAGAHQLEVTATDGAGNVSSPADLSAFIDETAPTISSVAAVIPNPTNAPVGSVDVTFSKAINLATFTTADLSLTDNGGANLIKSGVTISFVSGTTYQIGNLAGLTTSEGKYLLTVSAAGLRDQAGNTGTGSMSASWLMDSTPPTSTVGLLPAQTTSTSFLVSAGGSDPNGSSGSAPSGIASFSLFVSEDGGGFSAFATVTPANPSALFTGESGHAYGFYSVATDNAGYVQPTPASAQQTVEIFQTATATTVTPGLASVSFSQSATFTATVSSATGTPPDGSVQFLVNGAPYGSAVPLNGGTAQLPIAEPAGSYTIAAEYTGDVNYGATLPAARTSAALAVSKASTATVVTPGTANVSFGQSATFTAAVSSGNGTPPDGSVQFLVDGTAYGSSVPLSGGTAQLAIAEPAGSYKVAAEYIGDANYTATLPAAETGATLTVSPVLNSRSATATTVTPGTASVSFSQSATFTATVSSAKGTPPDGTVQFLVNGAPYGSTAPLSGGKAQLAISEPAGSYTVAAQYTGDANYAATLPAAETGASLSVGQAATTTAVTPGTSSVTSGQSATFTATVSSTAGTPADGTVQFLVNDVPYGSAVTLSGGTAQVPITELAGSYTVAAAYTGDTNYAATLPAAETSASLKVSPVATSKSATTTAVTPGTASVSVGQSATFTATVSSTAGTPPDGTVQFLVNDEAYGSPVPLSGGTAKLPIAELAGSYTVAAEYSGDANYAASLPAAETGASLSVIKSATVTVVTPGTASVSLGQSATFTVTVSSATGTPPDGSVQFLVDGNPYGNTVPISGGTAQLPIAEPAGSYTVAAEYTGDANYAATLPAAETSASLTVSSVVAKSATDTIVTPGTASVTLGESATFTATVSSATGTPPDGSVQFLVNSAAYGSPVPLSGGTAQLAITEPAGSYSVAAEYTGDANFAATLPAAETGASLTVSQAVTPATNLAISPNTGVSNGITDTGAVTFTGNLSATGMTVDVFDTSNNTDLGNATVTGTSFSLALNLAQGSHVLRARATLNGTSADAFFTVLVDLTPPTSHVNPLLQRGSSLNFTVSVTGSDGGSPPSGVGSYDIYSSTNGGKWTLWTNVSASSPSATFTGQSNTTYSFYSIAHDLAGNIESKNPLIEASTFLPDLTAPVTSVDSATAAANPSSVNTSTGTFTLNLTGNDPGGGLLTYFEVFVSVDGGAYQEAGPYAIPAGAADSTGNEHSTMIYQGLTDGTTHTYAFYSVGLDSAGNLQGAPSSPNVTFQEKFLALTSPSQLQVTGLTVEHGSPSRSYVRYLDLTFNESDSQSGGDLTSIVNSIGTSSSAIQIFKYDLNGDASSKTAVPLASPTILTVIDHAIEIDFGSGGIGGNPNTTASDGYYEVDIKLPNGQTAVHHFDRLLGDVTGDGIVDQNDLNEIAADVGATTQMGWTALSADVTGTGAVTASELGIATRSKGHKLGSGLSLG